MHQIIVETNLRDRLGEATGQILLCDSDGRALGFFSPLHGRPLVKNLQLDPPLSMAQIEELRKERTGKPLEEILSRLGLQ